MKNKLIIFICILLCCFFIIIASPLLGSITEAIAISYAYCGDKHGAYEEYCGKSYLQAEKIYKIGIAIQKPLLFKELFQSILLNDLAKVQAFNLKKPIEAENNLIKSIKIIERTKYSCYASSLAESYRVLGLIYENIKSEPSKAEKFYLKAARIAKTDKEHSFLTLALIYRDLAYLYQEEAFKDKKIRIKIKHGELKSFTTLRPNRAIILKNNSKIKMAEKYNLSAVELIKKYDKKKPQDLDYYLFNLAQFYEEIGEKDKEEAVYLELVSLKNNNSHFVSNLYFLSNIYVNKKQYNKAENLYLNVINESKHNERENYKVLAGCYKDLAKLYVDELLNEKNLFITKNGTKYLDPNRDKVFKNNPKIILAERYFLSAIELIKKYDISHLNDSLEELANFYGSIKEHGKEESTFLRIISKRNKENFVDYMYFLSNIYKAKKEYKKLENLLLNNEDVLANQDFIKNGLKYSNGGFVNKVYSDLADIYKNKKDYKKAEYYRKIGNSCYKEFYDSLH